MLEQIVFPPIRPVSTLLYLHEHAFFALLWAVPEHDETLLEDAICNDPQSSNALSTVTAVRPVFSCVERG
jgi:hypothetical protein